MRLPSLSYLGNSWLNAAKRFPLAMLTAIVATVCGMILIEQDFDNQQNESIIRLLITCFLFFPLFITAVAARESYDSSLGGHWIINGLLLILMVLYWQYWAPNDDFNYTRIARYVLFGSVSHLLVTFIPFLKESDLNDFWEYNRQLFIHFFTGALYAILIFLGIALALTAVKYLFDVDFDGKIYGHLFVATVGIFHTSFFLSNFPKTYQFPLESENFHRGFINLIKFVFISLVTLYFVILYSYGLKILITWELPKGWVSTLVIGFSIAGILTYLLNYLLPQIEGSGWVKTYRKYFFYILPAAVVLLFIAIFRRVGDYGVTEERYFVLLTGIWLAGISLYFIFSRKDDIRFIPITLAITCMIAAIGGPLSAFSISKKSQKNRLESLLTEANILQAGKIVSAAPILKGEKAQDITSVVKYLSNHNHLGVLSDWIQTDSLIAGDEKYYEKMNAVLETFGVSNTGTYRPNSNYRYYNSYHLEPVNIKAFDFYSKFNFYANNEREGKEEFYFTKTADKQGLIFHENGEPLDTLDLSQLMSILNKEFDNENSVSIQQMSHLHNGNQFSFLLTFDNLQFKIEDNSPALENAAGNVFWKKN